MNREKLKKELKTIAKTKYKEINNITDFISKNKETILKLAVNNEIKEQDFYKITSLLSSQSRSPLWENYFIQKNNATKVKKDDNKGDLIMNNIHYEYKISGFNKDNYLHVVQVRLWQNCKYVIEYADEYKKYTFVLTHAEMKKECKLLGQSAHGTKKALKENKNKEFRFSIKYNSKEFKRWVENYKK